MTDHYDTIFPLPSEEERGLTKREHFAGLVLHALLSNSDVNPLYIKDKLIESALEITDLFIRELDESSP